MKRVFCKKPAFWGTITILAVDAAVDFCALDSRCRGQVVERLWDFTVAGCVRRREERASYLRIPRRKDCCLSAPTAVWSISWEASANSSFFHEMFRYKKITWRSNDS
jgi:hypothetical protein